MEVTAWYVVAGAVLVVMALTGSVLKRLPLTPALFYLLIGVALGPYGVGLIQFHPVRDAKFVEVASEVAVIISLFTAGLKLRSPLRHARWRMPIRLAWVSMTLTVAAVAAIGVWLLDLPIGAAVLLGAVLAPTDPVLASDVQVESPGDPERLRFSLTGEAGLNDGTAFPFVMLGLGLMGLHEIGAGGWRWLAVDVLWAVAAGLGIGWLAGLAVGRLVLYLRAMHREAVGLDDFLSLGLIGLSYGVALWAHAYGFLAVFAAGLALRWIESSAANDAAPARGGGAGTNDAADASPSVEAAAAEGEREAIATRPETAPAYMAQAVLGFNEQLERIAEVAMVVLLGGMLIVPGLLRDAFWFVPVLLLVVRPLAVWVGTLGVRATRVQRGLIGWFGIRGVGSIYYLAYAIAHGVDSPIAERLVGLTFATIATSVVVHGISATPLMKAYGRLTRANSADGEKPHAARGAAEDDVATSV